MEAVRLYQEGAGDWGEGQFVADEPLLDRELRRCWRCWRCHGGDVVGRGVRVWTRR